MRNLYLSHKETSPLTSSWWLWPVLGLVIPLVGYALLPWMGVPFFTTLFSPEHLVMGLLAGLGLGLYGVYLSVCPQIYPWLLGFMAIGWLPLESFQALLLQEAGINLHLRPILLLLLAVPAAGLGWRYREVLWKKFPYLVCYLLFWGWLLSYFLWNNQQASTSWRGMDTSWFGDSIGVMQFFAYTFSVVGAVLAAITISQHRHWQHWFSGFNTLLLGVTALISLITLLGAPFGYFVQPLDGFQRAVGLFNHPNPFAHHQGILLLYFGGLFLLPPEGPAPFIKQIPKSILGICGWLVGMAFLLAFSKTAFGIFLGGGLVLALVNLLCPSNRTRLLLGAFCLFAFMLISTVAYQMVTGQGFWEILQNRLQQTQSFEWRQEVVNALWSVIHLENLFWGHGFTAANMWVFQFSYNTLTNTAPLMLVHQGYLALLYDLGLPGLLIFMAVVIAMIQGVGKLITTRHAYQKSLVGILLALCLYFLGVSSMDEMTYMFDAAQLFWILTALIMGVVWRMDPNGD